MTPPAGFQRISDQPPAGQNCGACTYWSAWLENTGDCMAYAYQRRTVLLSRDADEATRAEWPQRSAECTSRFQGCERFEREPEA